MRLFSSDPEVIRVGVDYLHIVTLNFVPSGITFVSASMFQAHGQHAAVAGDVVRCASLIGIVPAIFLSRRRRIRADVDLVADGAVDDALQMTLNLILLQREFRLKLA